MFVIGNFVANIAINHKKAANVLKNFTFTSLAIPFSLAELNSWLIFATKIESNIFYINPKKKKV